MCTHSLLSFRIARNLVIVDVALCLLCIILLATRVVFILRTHIHTDNTNIMAMRFVDVVLVYGDNKTND